MFDLTELTSMTFRVIDTSPGSEIEDPVEMCGTQVAAMITRATRDTNEFLDTIFNTECSESQNFDTNPESEALDTKTNDVHSTSPIFVEVNWEVDDNKIPASTQTIITSLVGLGILLTLRDIVNEHEKNVL